MRTKTTTGILTLAFISAFSGAGHAALPEAVLPETISPETEGLKAVPPQAVPQQAVLPELPPAPAAQAVSELLMLDARRALAAERARLPPHTPIDANGHPIIHPITAGTPFSGEAPTAGKPPPALASIYGMGRQLHAQLVIDGEETVFASGRPGPVAGASTHWRLKRIAPPCVDLESKEGAMRLCASRQEASR